MRQPYGASRSEKRLLKRRLRRVSFRKTGRFRQRLPARGARRTNHQDLGLVGLLAGLWRRVRNPLSPCRKQRGGERLRRQRPGAAAVRRPLTARRAAARGLTGLSSRQPSSGRRPAMSSRARTPIMADLLPHLQRAPAGTVPGLVTELTTTIATIFAAS